MANGWKPGAISKRLLNILKQAKPHQTSVEQVKPIKIPKKHIEEKPALIVSKKDGEYRIEMKFLAQSENVEPTPLVYTIASERNIDRVKKREKQKQRLVRKAVEEVWSDMDHHKDCEKTCWKEYKNAIGEVPFDLKNPDCIYPKSSKDILESPESSCDEELNSECSSLDDDWEIHFSPPIANRS